MQFTFIALALACLAVANATGNGGGSACNSGSLECCNSVQNANNPSTANLLTSLGIKVQDVVGPVGVTCTPLTIIGTGSNKCSQQTVCCSNNKYNGVVALGCNPVNIGP